MGLLSRIGWPPGSGNKQRNDAEGSEALEAIPDSQALNSSREGNSVPEEMDVKVAVHEFRKTVIEYKIQTGRDLSEGEQRKLAIEILLKHVNKHISETKLASGFLGRTYEKGVKLWDKAPKLVQFMLSQTLTSAVSLGTGAYAMGITSKVGLATRLATRVGINVILKGVLEGVAEEAVNPNPKPTFIQRVTNVFQNMTKSSNAGTLSFEDNSVSATFRRNSNETVNNATPTPSPEFNNPADTTAREAHPEQNLYMNSNGTSTGVPPPGRAISATGDANLQKTLQSSTAEIEQAKEEKRKMLKEILTYKNILLVGSLGPVFYLSGSIVGFTALGGLAVKEVYAYIVKQKIKLEEKKIKSEELTKRVSLAPMLNEDNLEIELDAKVLIKEFKALLPEIEKIAKKLKVLKNFKEGGDILISIFSDLGTETAYHQEGITINPQVEVFRHAPKAIKTFAKVGGIIEKAKGKSREEKAKEIRNTPKEKLNELKLARVRELDEIDYELFKVKYDLKELRPKNKKDKGENVLIRELESIGAIKERLKNDSSLYDDEKKALKNRIKTLEKISEARYLVESNEEKSVPETTDSIITTPENAEKIRMFEAGKIVLEEIKVEIKGELEEIKNTRNRLARLNMTPSEIEAYDKKQIKIQELKETENLVYLKNIGDCLKDIEAVYEKFENSDLETRETLETERSKLEKELVSLLDRFTRIQDARYALEGKTREQVLADAKYKLLKKKRMGLLLERERAKHNPDKQEANVDGDMSASVNPNLEIPEEEKLREAA
ncbi:MAG: hypothetical protein M3Q34_01695 [bacterium]|nr:hypothetical protein [bacterium]